MDFSHLTFLTSLVMGKAKCKHEIKFILSCFHIAKSTAFGNFNGFYCAFMSKIYDSNLQSKGSKLNSNLGNLTPEN